MSTNYFRLLEPITSIRLEESAGHDRLTVFENGANAGTLTLSKGAGRRVALHLVLQEEDPNCPVRTYYGGAEIGLVVDVNDKEMPDCATVVSEYGDVYTMGEVKRMEGKGKHAQP